STLKKLAPCSVRTFSFVQVGARQRVVSGHTLAPNKFYCIFRQMRVVAAGSSRSPVYPVGEGAAPSPRCSRRQPCRAYPGGFNPDQHGSTFQAEPLAAALNTGYCLLP